MFFPFFRANLTNPLAAADVRGLQSVFEKNQSLLTSAATIFDPSHYPLSSIRDPGYVV